MANCTHYPELDIDNPYLAKSEDDAATWAARQHQVFLSGTKEWRFDATAVESLQAFMSITARMLWTIKQPITVRELTNQALNYWLKDQPKRPPTYQEPEPEDLNRCMCAWVNHLSRSGCIPVQPPRADARAYFDLQGRYIIQLCRDDESFATYSVTPRRVTLLQGTA